MTPALLRKRIKRLAEALGLGDWEFQIVRQEYAAKDVSDLAGCQAKPEYKSAVLYFDVARIPPEELDSYIIHELLHCHIWELVALTDKLATTPAEREAIRLAEERLTTTLERLFARLLP